MKIHMYVHICIGHYRDYLSHFITYISDIAVRDSCTAKSRLMTCMRWRRERFPGSHWLRETTLVQVATYLLKCQRWIKLYIVGWWVEYPSLAIVWSVCDVNIYRVCFSLCKIYSIEILRGHPCRFSGYIKVVFISVEVYIQINKRFVISKTSIEVKFMTN